MKTFYISKKKEHAAKCFMRDPSYTYMKPQNPLAAQKSNETRKVHMFNMSQCIYKNFNVNDAALIICRHFNSIVMNKKLHLFLSPPLNITTLTEKITENKCVKIPSIIWDKM